MFLLAIIWELVVRFREDGTLYEHMKLPASVSRQLLNRIKTMSSLDVNISKTIQDNIVFAVKYDRKQNCISKE